MARAPARCPPLSRIDARYLFASARAAFSIDCRSWIFWPRSFAASSRFGVMSVARGNRHFSQALIAPGWSSGAPLVAVMTGSITNAPRLRILRTSATTLIISAEQRRPVLIAEIGKFLRSTVICSQTICALTGSMRETLPGISATMQVTALNP